MKQMLLALFLICGISVAAQAQTVVTGVETQERVVNLPEDAGNWHLSVFGDPSDAKFQEVQKWMDTDPALRKFRGRVHYHPIPTTIGMFDRYKASTPRTPCIRLQDSAGARVYEVSGPNVPMSPHALTNALNASIFRRCGPDGCPTPVQPVDPGPVPAPVDTPPVDTVPEPSVDWLWVIVSLLGGAGIGVAQWWKAQYFDNA